MAEFSVATAARAEGSAVADHGTQTHILFIMSADVGWFSISAYNMASRAIARRVGKQVIENSDRAVPE
jgi:hypothetical protein